jgi:hypothetical protein
MKKGTACPTELREQVIAWAVRQHEAGATWKQIQSELGLADIVRRWCVGRSQPKGRSLVPVEVVAEQPSHGSFSIVSPSGYRANGLTLSEAVALLRELG